MYDNYCRHFFSYSPTLTPFICPRLQGLQLVLSPYNSHRQAYARLPPALSRITP